MKILILIPLFLFATDKPTEGLAAKDVDPGETKALMHLFYSEFLQMRPYLASEEKFKTAQAQRIIAPALSRLVKKINEGPTATIQNSHGFRINFALIGDHLAKTQKIYNRGEWDYARMRLNATPNFCIQCHTQMPESGLKTFGLFDNFKQTSFENAEFLFVIRQYDRALTQFDELARKFPKSKVTSDELPLLYKRKLAIFWRIKLDGNLAKQNLEADLKNANLPVTVKQNIKSWLDAFATDPLLVQDLEKKSAKDLLKFLQGQLLTFEDRKIAPADVDAAKLLRATGIIYQRLQKEENSEFTPEWLLLLAQYERRLSTSFWYSLSDVYLRECVSGFPKQDVTKRCYDAYVENMSSHYTHGLPDDVKANIESLQQYIK